MPARRKARKHPTSCCRAFRLAKGAIEADAKRWNHDASSATLTTTGNRRKPLRERSHCRPQSTKTRHDHHVHAVPFALRSVPRKLDCAFQKYLAGPIVRKIRKDVGELAGGVTPILIL